MFAIKDFVRYKLAVDAEEQVEQQPPNGVGQPAASQSSQASATTQAVVGWRFKGSRAVVTGRGEIQENIGETQYTIELKVGENGPLNFFEFTF